MASLSRITTEHLRTNCSAEMATPRRPRLLRCNVTEASISKQSASRDVIITPASPSAVYLLNKMGSVSLNPTNADAGEVDEVALKGQVRAISYSEESSPYASVDYRTSDKASVLTGWFLAGLKYQPDGSEVADRHHRGVFQLSEFRQLVID